MAGNNISKRKKDILLMLIKAQSPISIGIFKEHFKKSERTIRYDLNELISLCQNNGVEIRYIKKSGFYIPLQQKKKCADIFLREMTALSSFGGTDSREQRLEELFLLLAAEDRWISADKIADSIFLSRSTTIRLLSELKERCESELSLNSKKALGYKLYGDELMIRETASAILSNRLKGSYTTEDWYFLLPGTLKDKISFQELLKVSNGIKKINSKYNVWISNNFFLKLFSYFLITKARLSGQIKKKKINFTDSKDIIERNYSAELLLEELSILSNKGEMKLLEDFLQKNGFYIQENDYKAHMLSLTLNQMVDKLKTLSGDDSYDYDSLYHDLYEHLKNSIGQAEGLGQENENVLKEVFDNYGEFYSISKELSKSITENMNIRLSKTEICYIAAYLYKNYREKTKTKLNVMVVCATGKGLSNLISMRIEKIFPELNIVGTASPYQILPGENLGDVDLVISTIPLEGVGVPVVKVSGILSEEDCGRIRDFLNYGEMLDEIPLAQKDRASFISKSEISALGFVTGRYRPSDMGRAAEIVSRSVITMLEYVSKISEEKDIDKEAMLGLVIHLVLALPRWINNEMTDDTEEIEKEYEVMLNNHKECGVIMEKFFELMEGMLQLRITTSERIAVLLYICQ